VKEGDDAERLLLLTLSVLDAAPARAARMRAAGLRDVLCHPHAFPNLLSEAQRLRLASGKAFDEAAVLRDTLARRRIEIVALCDADYPALLKEIGDPPPVLYLLGRRASLQEQDAPPIGIVGTRAASGRGRAFARCLAAELAAAGAVVVSGLARGIDTEAHTGAVAVGGLSLGVLGSGFDHFYPEENRVLARSMMERGAVLSEFPPQVSPHPGRFPQRNRVISALCAGIVVVEAPSKSGALVTARLALDAGREVMAVPGFPGQRQSEGTNELIREGATLIRNAADVAASLGLQISKHTAKEATTGLSVAGGVLTAGVPYGLEDIEERTGLRGSELLSILGGLELSGEVRRVPGARYVVGAVRKGS
jgi:DNA processing protein